MIQVFGEKMSEEKFTHKIIEQYMEYVGGDCYGYVCKCKCGETITGWTSNECTNEAIKHILIEEFGICEKDYMNHGIEITKQIDYEYY